MGRETRLVLLSAVFATLGWLLHNVIWSSSSWLFVVLAAIVSAPVAWLNRREEWRFSGRWLVTNLCGCLALSIAFGDPGLVLSVTATACALVPALYWRVTWVQRLTVMVSCLAALFVVLESVNSALNWFLFDTAFFDTLFFPVIDAIFDAERQASAISLYDGRRVHRLHFSLEETHLLWCARYGVAIWVLSHTLSVRLSLSRLIHHVIACSAVVTLVWLAVVIGFWNLTKHAGVFLDWRMFVVVEAVGVMLYVPLMPGSRSSPETGRTEPLTSLRLAGPAFLVLGCSVTLFSLWFPLGPRKSISRVLVDDSHSTWESSDAVFDFSDEGLTRGAAYSYTNFVDIIGKHYPCDINKSQSLDDVDLGQYSVVLIKTPTEPLSKEEISCLRSFVERGGGLFVHGDHTNLFGMSSYLNQLLDRTGIEFNFDDQATFVGRPSRHETARLLRHPTMRSSGEFQFLTSCTLTASSILVEPVISGAGIFSENARYGRPGFFGNMAYEPLDRLGPFLQAAVVPFGRGRVAVFCDSTVFSNFSCFQSDYMRYALSTIEYLQRTNTGGRWRVLVLTAFSGLVCIGCVLFQRECRRRLFDLLMCHALAGVVGGAALAAMLGAETLMIPDPREDVRIAAFVLGDADLVDPLSGDSMMDSDEMGDFSQFFVAWQRHGYWPRVYGSLREIPEGVDVVVLINPDESVSLPEQEQLVNRVSVDGTVLMVLQSSRQNPQHTNEMLAGFGMGIRWQTMRTSHGAVSAAPALAQSDRGVVPIVAVTDFLIHGNSVRLSGNVPFTGQTARLAPVAQVGLLVDQDQQTVLAYSQFGPGRVFIHTDSTALSAASLGPISVLAPLSRTQLDSVRAAGRIIEATDAEDPGLCLLGASDVDSNGE